MHPSVVFYRCPVEGCTTVVHHEIIHLSSVLKHTFNAFKKFHCDTVKIVEKAIGSSLSLIVNVTDNCGSQYKNCHNFWFMSELHTDIIHLFLGSRHEKGPSDQTSGRFKLPLNQAIVSDRVHVQCAKDIFDFARKEYVTPPVDKDVCQHFHVDANLVTKIPCSKGSHSVAAEETCCIHAVRNNRVPGIILKCMVGCLCQPCVSSSGKRQLPCKYPEYFEPWKKDCVSK